ncbi:MAG: right-handed parallel beta-helix repeat-containing protein, partial [Candidatus Aenigmarchaeota archaeon]|nr:right-handed parallel beta-helix repeat-containing protein [Candidatus Aenigmarchaeota archaeon]
KGYTIQGTNISNRYGIGSVKSVSTDTNISIKKCIVKNWSYGIYLRNSNKNNIINNHVSGNMYGIRLIGSSDNSVINNTAMNNGFYGIYLLTLSGSENTDRNSVVGNYIYNNSIGIALSAACDNIIENNAVDSNINYGIHIGPNQNIPKISTGNIVRGNNVFSTNTYKQYNGHGIHLLNSTNTLIEKNNIFDNSVGIYTEGEEYSVTIESNYISDNSRGGIGCLADEYLEVIIQYNNLSDNSCSGEGGDLATGGGIRIHGTNNEVSIINATVIANKITNIDGGDEEPHMGVIAQQIKYCNDEREEGLSALEYWATGGHFRAGYSLNGATAKETYVTLTDNYMEGGYGSSLKIHASDYLKVNASNNQFLNTHCTNKIGYTWSSAVGNLDAVFTNNVFSNTYDMPMMAEGEWYYGSLLKILADESINTLIRGNVFEGSTKGTVRVGWVCWEGGHLTTQNVTAIIADNSFQNNRGGSILTKAETSLDAQIYNNNIDDTSCEGEMSVIEVASDNIIHSAIYDNTITEFRNSGIYVSGPVTNSVHIYENTISHGETGIYANCPESVIENNTIHNVYNDGEPECGIHLEESNNSIVKNNSITNSDTGIFLHASSHNNITDNYVSDNEKGIVIGFSNNNLIYNNYLNNTINSFDDGNNFWNTTNRTGTNIIGGPNIGGN